ncbi:PAS domain-containing protein [Microvirga sp. BT689]|uniref:PAS domain-containing protein n=1 Tax=Microvirga arvi TaxID=2778731 RepID=UPI00194E7E79|nr:PAS domain-containing protein [Microvirga arvi]MBM6581708.1 PAS domain-containing protein [Microvirga arvi]
MHGSRSPATSPEIVDGGEMGTLMRAFDWAATPLGPIERWPHSLKTLAAAALESRVPTILAWGPDLTCIYNDAYCFLLASKADTFGRPLREAWAAAINILNPAIDRVLAGEATSLEIAPFTLLGDVHSERRFFKCHLSPVRDDHGRIAGLLSQGIEASQGLAIQPALCHGDIPWRSLFERLHEGALIGEVVRDPDGRITDWRYLEVNPAWEELVGISREAAVGHTLRETIPGIEGEWVDEFAHVVETGQPVTFTRQVGVLNRWYEGHAFHIGAERFAVLFLEITERQQAKTLISETEARLAMERERFTALINNLPVGVCFIDQDSKALLSNPAFRRFLPDDPLPSRTPDGEERWVALDNDGKRLTRDRYPGIRALRGEESAGTEFRFRPSDGQEIWTRVSGVPVWNSEGQVGAALVVIVDINEQKRAQEALERLNERLEAEVAQRTAELRSSEARLRTIFETSYQYQWLMAPDGTLLDANTSSLEGIQSAREGVVGKPFRDTPWFTATPGMPETVRVAVARVAGGETMRQEIFLNLPSGQRAFDLSMRPVQNAGGEVVAIVPEAVDITERRHAEEALRQSQKMEAVGQLTGGVAHDFNNLLTIIRSATDLLRRSDLPEDRRQRYIEAIADTVERASKLTGQLLAFARRQALKPEVFDVVERIRAIIDMLRTVLGSRIQIVTDIGYERCLVEADASQFETALVNMAVNARDAMDGEGILTIRVQGVMQMPPIRGHGGGAGSFIAVSLADTGSGIPADKLARIFEPFYTTKEVGRGTGLGLSQVYGFAKQSGGDVDVETELRRGTTFTLYLPQVTHTAAEAAPHVRGAVQGDTGGGRSVLVVEDNVEVGTFSTQLLRDIGYETTWAANADEALKLLHERMNGFDVVFSDVVMPGMSGVELGQEIRRRFPCLPVVLTSGYSHVLAEEGRYGFELLKKPYAVEELSRVLQSVIQVRKGGA